MLLRTHCGTSADKPLSTSGFHAEAELDHVTADHRASPKMRSWIAAGPKRGTASPTSVETRPRRRPAASRFHQWSPVPMTVAIRSHHPNGIEDVRPRLRGKPRAHGACILPIRLPDDGQVDRELDQVARTGCRRLHTQEGGTTADALRTPTTTCRISAEREKALAVQGRHRIHSTMCDAARTSMRSCRPASGPAATDGHAWASEVE
jgi:hypothetical protein